MRLGAIAPMDNETLAYIEDRDRTGGDRWDISSTENSEETLALSDGNSDALCPQYRWIQGEQEFACVLGDW